MQRGKGILLNSFVIILLLTAIIHASETLSYAIRYAGIKTGRIAVALSLTGIVVLVSRTSNLFQAPLTGKMIDYARSHADFNLEYYFRIIIGASSVGTMFAMLLFPSVVFLSARLIVHLETAGSIPKLVTSVTVDKLKNASHHLRRPTFSMLKSLRILGIPKRLLLLNALVTGFYTVGVLSSLFAAYLNVHNSTAASQSSGLINGFATIILTLFIDPQIAMLTDKSLQDSDIRSKLGKVFAVIMISRWAGTLAAQLLFLPSAYWINWVVNWI